MPSRLVDFHCHLDLYPDHAAAISACERAEIFTLAVTTTPKAWPRNRDLTRDLKYVRAGLGLHPQLVGERAEELTLWESYLPDARYVGEIGLDAGPRFQRSLPLQQQVFERVLKCCAKAGGKVLSVHSVRTTSLVLDLIQSHLPPERGKVVLHWFTGSRTDAGRAVQLGCLFSINLAMLGKEQHRNMIADLPLDALLTETDGPFTMVGTRPSEPQDVAKVVDEIASLRKLDPMVIRDKIGANFRRLLSGRDEVLPS